LRSSPALVLTKTDDINFRRPKLMRSMILAGSAFAVLIASLPITAQAAPARNPADVKALLAPWTAPMAVSRPRQGQGRGFERAAPSDAATAGGDRQDRRQQGAAQLRQHHRGAGANRQAAQRVLALFGRLDRQPQYGGHAEGAVGDGAGTRAFNDKITQNPSSSPASTRFIRRASRRI